MEITKAEFEAYLRVQQSGVTNMMATSDVAYLSGLTQEKVKTIRKNYSALADEFGSIVVGA